jgi:hypothetical protein
MCYISRTEASVDQSPRDLELRGKNLFRQWEDLGDFRHGAISVNDHQCGKSNCAWIPTRLHSVANHSGFTESDGMGFMLCQDGVGRHCDLRTP